MARVGLSLSVVSRVDPSFWRGRHVLVTGHTGFKGAWLSVWLRSLGATVAGLSLGPLPEPSLYDSARVGEAMADEFIVDVGDYGAVAGAVAEFRPEIVVHMAAQSLVRRSFVEPRETYQTNVMGTVNLFEAVRRVGGARVVVNVTSDKCYENREWEWGYREDEPMGGLDPYSSSKGCAELVTRAFRHAFFETVADGVRVASVRAGNVIGGGDWAEDRLLPDIMRAALGGESLRLRNPDAIRPWQHVLNPLSGYLVLAQALWKSDEYATAWNFGPADDDARPVSSIVRRVSELWPGELSWEDDAGPRPREAQSLRVDSSRARLRLGWRPTWNLDEALVRTVAWYRAFSDGGDMRAVTIAEVEAFAADQVLVAEGTGFQV